MYCDQSCCEPLKKMLPLGCDPHIFILFWFLLLIFCYDIDLWAEIIIRVKESQEPSESLDSDNDFRSGCRNVSHHYRQQSFSGPHSPRWLNYTITCYPQVQTIYCKKCIYFLFLATITFLYFLGLEENWDMRVVLQRQCSLIQNFLYVIIVFLKITPLPSRSNTTPLKELSINKINNLKDQLPSVLSQSDLLKKGKGLSRLYFRATTESVTGTESYIPGACFSKAAVN